MATKTKVKGKQATAAAKALLDKMKKEATAQRRSTRRSGVTADCQEQIAGLRAEVDRLTAENGQLQAKNGDLAASVERLTAECEFLADQLSHAATLLVNHFEAFASCVGQQIFVTQAAWGETSDHWRKMIRPSAEG